MSTKTQLDRPQVLTPAVQAKIVEMMMDGVALTTACVRAGTTHYTVRYWRTLVEEGAEHAQIYADFFTAIKKAEAEAEHKALKTIKKGGFGWQAQAWFLERRFPQRWGAKQRDDKPQAKQAEVIEEAKKKADARRNDRKPV